MSGPSFLERAARALCAVEGTDPEQWKASIPRVGIVMDAMGASLVDGQSVRIPNVGTLKTRLKRRRLNRPGPDRGKNIEERVAMLFRPEVITAGEPYDPA